MEMKMWFIRGTIYTVMLQDALIFDTAKPPVIVTDWASTGDDTIERVILSNKYLLIWKLLLLRPPNVFRHV